LGGRGEAVIHEEEVSKGAVEVTQSQLFAVAVRILGVYLLVQALMQFPDGFVESITLLVLWIRADRGPLVSGVAMYLPHAISAFLGFILFAAAGLYLIRGAPHLFRLAGIAETTQGKLTQQS
jgi:hypothetical protein